MSESESTSPAEVGPTAPGEVVGIATRKAATVALKAHVAVMKGTPLRASSRATAASSAAAPTRYDAPVQAKAMAPTGALANCVTAASSPST